jgi:hypothetical protein
MNRHAEEEAISDETSLRPIARKQPLPGCHKTVESAQVAMSDAKLGGFIGLPGQCKPQLTGADQLQRSWYLNGSTREERKQAGWNNAFLTQTLLQTFKSQAVLA